MQLRPYCKSSARFIHSFDGIEHEVHEHLLQLHAVGLDSWEFAGEFRAHGNGVSDRLTLQQCEHFVDDVVHVDQFTLWRRLPIQRPDTVDVQEVAFTA